MMTYLLFAALTVVIHVFICQNLHPVHCQLLEAFEKCVQSGSADVSPYFLNAREGLLDYGAYAAKLPRAIERVSEIAVCQF